MRKQTKFHIDGCEKKAEFFIYLGKNYKEIFQEMGKVISLLRFYRESENLYILEYRLTIEDSVGVIKLISYYGFIINTWLGLFNLIPFWMFDGKKILTRSFR